MLMFTSMITIKCPANLRHQKSGKKVIKIDHAVFIQRLIHTGRFLPLSNFIPLANKKPQHPQPQDSSTQANFMCFIYFKGLANKEK